MSNRLKFILLGLILANIPTLALPSFTEGEKSPIYINGQDMGMEIPEEMEVSIDWGSNKNGEEPNTTVAWIENGGELVNYGKLIGSGYEVKSRSTIYLLAHSSKNFLQKEDTLIKLKDSTFINKNIVEMGSLNHELTQNGVGLLSNIGDKNFANYVKTVISAENSKIKNEGIITSGKDTFSSAEYLKITIANFSPEMKNTYEKNILKVNNGIVENNGTIEYTGDINPQFAEGLKLSAITKELTYTRNTYGINSVGGKVINSGNISIRGDIYKEESKVEIIEIGALNADFKGINNKYGIKATTGGEIINTGSIIVEKDFTKKIGIDGEIAVLKIIGSGYDEDPSLIGLGLLSFKNMKERSVGVSLDRSTFNNENGEITVEVNKGGSQEEIEGGTAAIAVEGTNSSKINFNGGEINLGGSNVYASNLSENSVMTFTGVTEINYLDKDTDKFKVNNSLFNNDKTSWHNIKGDLKINGNLTLEKGNNFSIGIRENDKERSNEYGQLITEGHLTLNENVVVDTGNLIGLSQEELAKYSNQSLIVAGNGISGDGKLVSNSYLFNLNLKKENGEEGITKDVNNKEEIKLESVERKDFTTIVDNSDLGKMLENSYETLTEEQRKIYEQLALASNESEFLQGLDEITGRKNVNTISSQVYDITKDLTKNYRELIKENREDGISFKYINSKSEFSNTDIAEGFDRESYGIVTNYNKNLNEKLRVGFGFGYLKSNIDYTPSESSNKIETWNFRGYGDYNLGKVNLLSDFSFGYNDIENNRISGGVLNKGDVETYTFGLNNSLYKEIKVNNKLRLVPSLNLDMTYLLQKDYKEDKGAEFKESDNFFIRSGVNLLGEYNIFSTRNHKVNLKTNLEYSYDFNEKVEEVEGKIYGFNDYIKYEAREIDKSSLVYDIGLSYEYMDKYSIGVKYTKELINDVDNDQIGVDFTYKF